MPHPQMFDDVDPVLVRLRALVAALPETSEKVSHGRPHFAVGGARGRGFAIYGGSVRRGAGDHERHERGLLVKVDPVELPAVDADPRFWLPAYVGHAGWRGLDLPDPAPGAADEEWAEVAELLDASYRLVAPARALRLLEARDR